MNMKNFITFEGGECSGKTTVINEIQKKLNELNPYSNSNKENGVLNPITLNNLNDFYIQAPAGDGINGTFNLSNFYINHPMNFVYKNHLNYLQ